jgi:hypothetical protein
MSVLENGVAAVQLGAGQEDRAVPDLKVYGALRYPSRIDHYDVVIRVLGTNQLRPYLLGTVCPETFRNESRYEFERRLEVIDQGLVPDAELAGHDED